MMQDVKPPDASLSANRSMYPGEASQPPTFCTNRSIPDGRSSSSCEPGGLAIEFGRRPVRLVNKVGNADEVKSLRH
jgi:hypothetical protein